VWPPCPAESRRETRFSANTVQLRRITASRKDLVGWGQSLWVGLLTLNLDILRLTTRGLLRFALGGKGVAATSSRSLRYSRGWSALAVRW
ncbi:MAG: hypothetical protein LC775_04530, partial [Acidobacteria bacterium]|nr:hypothetical protein [Acidobacteriota bacterium]